MDNIYVFLCFDENYKTITKYYTVPIQLNCFWSKKQNPLLSNIERIEIKN
jgi:hypothetical protein